MERISSWDSRRSTLARASLGILTMSLMVSYLLFISSTAAAAEQSPTNPSESAALQSINANAWQNKKGADPCRDAWQGITCDGGAPLQHVLAINLNGTGGILPTSFFSSIVSLQYLDSLNLSNCNLTGALSTLSVSLSNLSAIRSLDLSGNSFVGEIPEIFDSLPALQNLSLAENRLQGQVPEDVCQAKNLTVLNLEGNSFEGPLPPCLGNLPSLAVLNICYNNLTGSLPESLGRLSALTELHLGLNSFTGSLPASLTGLSSLTKLHLNGNLLEGALPEDIHRMSKLEELHLDSNRFTGRIPASICRLQSLQKLRLFDNQLIGDIPKDIGNLTRLTVLFLHANKLRGHLPMSLGNLTLLQELQLQGNRLNGRLRGRIWSKLTSLRILYVHFNELEGEIPWQTLLLGSLTDISLGFNKFSGSIPNPQNKPGAPPHISNLRFLSVCNNSLTGSIPSDFSVLGNLEFLDLSNNQFNGSIPSQLTSMINTNRVQANLLFNDFDQSSWSTIQGSNPCSQMLNGTLNPQCVSSGSSKGLAINVGGPLVTSELTGVNFIADDNFTALLGSYHAYSSDHSSGIGPSPMIWGMDEQGVVRESQTSIITSSASPYTNWIRYWTLFQTARVGADTLSYRIAHLTPGEYTVDLYFAELDTSVHRSGQREFGVYIQGEQRIATLDIFNITGGTSRPMILSFPVSISNGVISVRLVGRGSWPATQEQMMVYRGPILSALNVRQISKHKPSVMPIAAGVGGSVFGLAVLLLSVCVSCVLCHSRRGTRRVGCSWRKVGLLPFKYAELEAATNKFSERNLIGQGAFGSVFKGVLSDGATVAIKKLSIRDPNSLESLHNELQVISTVSHRNLVPLIGWCLEQECPIIVCQYMPNGNLHDALFKESSPVSLSWSARCKIALDIARGLHYLHEEGIHKIVHRDVKPLNILLDKELSACIADFGMARLLAEQEFEVITGVMGTRGYMAPEYALNGQLSDKVDVFSFGVVLLELVIGKRGMQSSASTELVPLCHWAWQMFTAENFEEMVDKRLGGDYVLREVITMLKVAIWCTEYYQSFRPSMCQVLRMLTNEAEVPPLPQHRRGYGAELGDFSRPFEAQRWEQYKSSHGDRGPAPSLELSRSRSWGYSGSDFNSMDAR